MSRRQYDADSRTQLADAQALGRQIAEAVRARRLALSPDAPPATVASPAAPATPSAGAALPLDGDDA